MHVNSTASYTPSYTANYGAAEQAKSKASTKVVYDPTKDSVPEASFAHRAQLVTQLVQKVGTRLNAQA